MPEKLRSELKRLSLRGLQKTCYLRQSGHKPYLMINGRKIIDFSSWDIYDLVSERTQDRAVHKIIEERGIEIQTARQYSGTSDLLDRLESKVAKFFSQDCGLLFPSTKQAWMALIGVLVKTGDAILFDEHLNAPIADIASIVEAQSFAFDADDLDSLKQLRDTCQIYRNIFICCESISSKTGQVRDLKNLALISQTMDAELFIEETFAVGAIGLRLAGLFDELSITKPNATIICDPSFVLQGMGGLVATDVLLGRYLFSNSSAFQRDPVLPDLINEVLIKSLDHIELQKLKLVSLLERSLFVKTELAILGYKILSDDQLPYIVIGFDDQQKSDTIYDYLFAKGFLLEKIVRAFDSGVNLRVILNIAHRPEQIQSLLQAFADAKNVL